MAEPSGGRGQRQLSPRLFLTPPAPRPRLLRPRSAPESPAPQPDAQRDAGPAFLSAARRSISENDLLRFEEEVSVTASRGVEPPVNYQDDKGWSALHWAAVRGQAQLAGELLAMGAELEVRTGKYKQTPLHLASSDGHIEVIDMLFDWGADVLALNSKGRSPLDMARRFGEEEAAAHIKKLIAVRAGKRCVVCRKQVGLFHKRSKAGQCAQCKGVVCQHEPLGGEGLCQRCVRVEVMNNRKQGELRRLSIGAVQPGPAPQGEEDEKQEQEQAGGEEKDGRGQDEKQEEEAMGGDARNGGAQEEDAVGEDRNGGAQEEAAVGEDRNGGAQEEEAVGEDRNGGAQEEGGDEQASNNSGVAP